MALSPATEAAIQAAKDLGVDITKVQPKKEGDAVSVKDVELYAKSLKKAETPPADEKKVVKAEPEVPEDKKPSKLICVFRIKEDETTFEPGAVYTGKNAKYLLAKKSIKKV